MRFMIGLLALTLTFGVVGCGGPSNEFVEQVNFDVNEAIKSDLEGVVKAGRLGSGYGHLKSCVPALTKIDAAKGEAVGKAIEELATIKDSAKLKAKAQQIIDML
jgi:hypothetical protein